LKTKLFVIGVVVAGFVGGPLLRDALAVTDEEFRALQQQMQQQGEQIQDLKKGREEDQKEIQRLKDKVGETEKKATETQKATEETQKKLEETQKVASEAAAKVQPVNPVPSEEATAKGNFLLSGAFNVVYSKTEGSHGSFAIGEFNPLFLYRYGDKVLFEGEMVFSLDTPDMGGETEATTEIEYATLDYLLNDYVTIVAGKMILPLATFKERLDASWINKLPTFPLPYRDEVNPIAPEGDIGIQARGGFHLGDTMSLGYSVYLVNGPNSDVETNGTETINLGRTGSDFNGSPSGGGRLGLFIPCTSRPNTDFEIGVSGQTGTWDTKNDLLYSVFALDAALHLGPALELRAEYLRSWQERSGQSTLERDGVWAQIAYSLSGLDVDFPMIRNTELVFRYGGDANPGGYVNQYALGLDYHITHTLQFKADYEFNSSHNHDFDNNQFNLQMAWGF
jgi:hypothetical protein